MLSFIGTVFLAVVSSLLPVAAGGASGNVLDADNRAPIAGATVTIAGRRVADDERGSFALDGVPSDLQYIQVSAPGYATYNSGTTIGRESAPRTIRLSKITREEAAWLAHINRDRAAHGVAPVAFDEVTLESARHHAKDMAAKDYFNHIDSDGLKPYARYASMGGVGGNAENIAAGAMNTAETQNDFMSEEATSGGHYLNIVDPAHQWVGLGIARGHGKYGIWYDQQFMNLATVYDPATVPAQTGLGQTVTLRVRTLPNAGSLTSGYTHEPPATRSRESASGSYGYSDAPMQYLGAVQVATSLFDVRFKAANRGQNQVFIFAKGLQTQHESMSNGLCSIVVYNVP